MSTIPARLSAALAERYRLEGELGAGGMATVYLAGDLKHQRQVAVKVLRPELAAALGAERFLQEITTTANLRHPHILPLYDSGEADGFLYYVMPFVDGESLRDRLKRESQLPVDEALRLVGEIADALGYAHEAGVIHRDIKPENVLLERGHAVVTDFGIARAVTAAGGEKLTQTGLVLGTPLYMSPEQASGETVDARGDLYSLACLLYEMLAGSPPFTGSTALVLMARHALDPVPALRTARPAVSPTVADAIERALAKTPADRYATVQAWRDALTRRSPTVSASGLATRTSQRRAEAEGTNTSDVSVPDSGGYGIRASTTGAAPGPSSSGRMILRMAIGVGAVVAMGGALWFGTRNGRLSVAPHGVPVSIASVAILPFTASAADEAFADGIHEDMITQVSKVGALKVIARTSVQAFKGTTRKASEIAADLGVATILEGSVRHIGDRVRINVTLIDARSDASVWSESYDRELTALSMFEIQTEIARRVASALQVALSPGEQRALQTPATENLEAYQSYLKGLTLERSGDEAEIIEGKVAAYGEAVHLDPSFAHAWARLAIAHLQMYWRGVDRSTERLERARQALDRATVLSPTLPETAAARGYYQYWGFRNYPQALQAFEEARRGLPNDASLIAVIAFIQRRLGRWDESVAGAAHAIELDPRNQYLLLNQYNTFAAMRRNLDAERMLDRWAEISPVDDAVARNRALLHTYAGDPGLALALGENEQSGEVVLEARLLARDFPAALHGVEGWPAAGLEDQLFLMPKAIAEELVRVAAGNARGAGPAIRRATDDLEEREKRNPADPRVPAALGLAYALVGNQAAAVSAARRAIELLPYTKDAMDAGAFVFNLAQVYTLLGQKDEAVRQLDRYLSHPGFFGIGYVERHPLFDPLRGDPAFEAMLRSHRSTK